MKHSKLLLVGITSLLFCPMAFSAAYTVGNLVVSRVGTGSAALSGNATEVFIDEYTTAGSNVGNTVALPTSSSGSNFALTLGGTSTSQGQLTRSSDGRFLSIMGYDAPVGTTTPASNASFRGRTVGIINLSGSADTATRFEAAGTTPRAAITVDGTSFWLASDGGSGNTGGLRYTTYASGTNGALLNSTTTNIRTANIANGQLYIGASTGVGGDFRGVSAVGTGIPNVASSFTLLAGMGGSNAGFSDSTYDFYFANASTVYVTDDDTTAPASGGVQKWSFNGTSWTKLWTVNSTGATGARSITGLTRPDGSVEIYAIASNATTDLISIVDTGSGTPTASILASAPANTVFRGVELAVPEPTTLGALAGLMTLVRRRRA